MLGARSTPDVSERDRWLAGRRLDDDFQRPPLSIARQVARVIPDCVLVPDLADDLLHGLPALVQVPREVRPRTGDLRASQRRPREGERDSESQPFHGFPLASDLRRRRPPHLTVTLNLRLPISWPPRITITVASHAPAMAMLPFPRYRPPPSCFKGTVVRIAGIFMSGIAGM